jgi:hypothetical protein
MTDWLLTPLFILGVLPSTAFIVAGLLGRLSRRQGGSSKPLLLAFAGVLLVPILLVLWLLLWPLGASLARAPQYMGNVIIPLLALSLGIFLAYRLALFVSTWRLKEHIAP